MAEKKTGGLAGITAGQTAISTVGKTGVGLTYRGYEIEDLAAHASFEEVAYLMLYGKLPNKGELADYKHQLIHMRALPDDLKDILEHLSGDAHPMDILRTACSALGVIEPENTTDDQYTAATRLLAAFPAMLLYWHHFKHNGKRIETASDDDSTADYFLHLLHGKRPDELQRQALNASLILYTRARFHTQTGWVASLR